jgi:protein disulfide-isomerase-like protein
MAGTPALVDFYAPYCKYCKELDPIWQQLGEKFASSSDRVIIAKMDVDAYKSFKERFSIEGYPTIYYFDGRTETPEAYPWSRDLEWLIRFLEERTGAPAADTAVAPVPPPINLNSKPAISQVKALISRPAPAPALTSGCLICRDFSRPDQIASQYPRESLPRGGDLTAYLADVLCGSLNSYTDKARAIFTWLHHNIAYDTGAFFSNNVKHVSPADVITTGLAVCGGYAGLFVAIALKAGMECVMVTGHGKGYGYSPL